MPKPRKKLIYVTEPPNGLFYIPQFLTADEQETLLSHATGQSFEPYDHNGYKANREVAYFGTPGYGIGDDAKRRPLPDWLTPLRSRFAELVGVAVDEIEMALIARYDVGAGIGWHRDRPQFGPTVMGVSLASQAEMRFRRYLEDREEMFKIDLAPGSAYLMSGPARAVWQHGMNPVKELRYSITFRTIKDRAKGSDWRQTPDAIAERMGRKGIVFGAPEKDKMPQQLTIAL